MSKLLEIQPKELRFTVEPKKQSMCLVRLTNITSYYVAFKVKTTSPKRYCVKPNVGIVMPNSSYDFTVAMQVPKSIEFECKDKFLIQSTTVSAETTDKDITANMFIRDGGNYVEEKKLKVILVVPPDSPTLSPINGALGHGMDRETSFFRDQPVDRPENLSKQHTVTEDREEPVLSNIKVSKTDDDKKLKPMKSVLFKLEHDVAELKPEKHAEELKPAKQVEVLSPEKEIEELKPVTNVKELRPSKLVEELKPVMNNVVVEELSSAKHVEELYPAMVKEESKPVMNVEESKPAMNVEESKSAMNEEELNPAIEVGFKTVGNVEMMPEKAVELKSTRAVEDDSYLAKDVKEIKSKLGEFELKLSKAEFAISKLMVERNSNIEERKHLHEKLAELSKRDVKQVQVGFPLLFVFMVALIGIVLGYRLHP